MRMIAGWLALLGRLGGEMDPDYVDWLAVDRVEVVNPGGEQKKVIQAVEHRYADVPLPPAPRASL